MEGFSAVISRRAVWCCSVAERWWLVAGRRKDGRRDPDADADADASRVTCTEEERLTSLFGGIGGGGRSPIMGAVEPSWEKAIDPLEQETDGDNGPGLVSLLDAWEVEMVDRRWIHEARRDDARAAGSRSSVSWSGEGVWPLGGCSGGSVLVILLTMRRGRPS
jgi:hypothetical protein